MDIRMTTPLVSPSTGEKKIAETLTNCGSAGGGVAIMLTLYELGGLMAGIHSLRCLGQSCAQRKSQLRRQEACATKLTL